MLCEAKEGIITLASGRASIQVLISFVYLAELHLQYVGTGMDYLLRCVCLSGCCVRLMSFICAQSTKLEYDKYWPSYFCHVL